jgi:hypothetical protein
MDARSERLEDLLEEARYRRERLELYRAKLYSGRGHGLAKLRELERSHDGAVARLRQAQARAADSGEPTA